MNPEVRTAIDRLISRIAESGNRLEDCLMEDREMPDLPEPESKEPLSDGFGPWEEERLWKNPCINGASGRSLFNCFPSSRRTVCHEVKFFLLPRTPKVGSMGQEELVEYGEAYFSAAVDSLLHWADQCKGKHLVILTDTWPLPGTTDPYPRPRHGEDPIDWFFHHRWMLRHHRHMPHACRRLHTQIGWIVRKYNIRCEVHLFTARGRITQLPDPDLRDWPPGW